MEACGGASVDFQRSGAPGKGTMENRPEPPRRVEAEENRIILFNLNLKHSPALLLSFL